MDLADAYWELGFMTQPFGARRPPDEWPSQQVTADVDACRAGRLSSAVGTDLPSGEVALDAKSAPAWAA